MDLRIAHGAAMTTVVLVAIGGAFGAIARYRLNGLIERHTSGSIPVGILVINTCGSLLLGVLVGLHLDHGLSTTVELGAGLGFCGGFTTFSTLMYDVTRLAQIGDRRRATLTMSLNFVLGGMAAALGLLATGAL